MGGLLRQIKKIVTHSDGGQYHLAVFTVAPCINDIKCFIVKLMHSII